MIGMEIQHTSNIYSVETYDLVAKLGQTVYLVVKRGDNVIKDIIQCAKKYNG